MDEQNHLPPNFLQDALSDLFSNSDASKIEMSQKIVEFLQQNQGESKKEEDQRATIIRALLDYVDCDDGEHRSSKIELLWKKAKDGDWIHVLLILFNYVKDSLKIRPITTQSVLHLVKFIRDPDPEADEIYDFKEIERLGDQLNLERNSNNYKTIVDLKDYIAPNRHIGEAQKIIDRHVHGYLEIAYEWRPYNENSLSSIRFFSPENHCQIMFELQKKCMNAETLDEILENVVKEYIEVLKSHHINGFGGRISWTKSRCASRIESMIEQVIDLYCSKNEDEHFKSQTPDDDSTLFANNVKTITEKKKYVEEQIKLSLSPREVFGPIYKERIRKHHESLMGQLKRTLAQYRKALPCDPDEEGNINIQLNPINSSR